MRQLFSVLLLSVMAFALSACHCKTCSVSLPGDCCKPCPQPPKRLKCPLPKPRCELPKWPDRPVKCVSTQVCRKCCHYEKCCTPEGYPYKIEVCEITYKSLYTDGSSRIWTEVSRNPVTNSPSKLKKSGVKSRSKHSLVGDRCDCKESVPETVQHLNKHVEKSVCEIKSKVKSDLQKAQ